MAKDDAITKLTAAIERLDQSVSALYKQQVETNERLRKLVEVNTAFLGTLTTFLDLDNRMKRDRERKDLEQAKTRIPTPADLLY